MAKRQPEAKLILRRTNEWTEYELNSIIAWLKGNIKMLNDEGKRFQLDNKKYSCAIWVPGDDEIMNPLEELHEKARQG